MAGCENGFLTTPPPPFLPALFFCRNAVPLGIMYKARLSSTAILHCAFSQPCPECFCCALTADAYPPEFMTRFAPSLSLSPTLFLDSRPVSSFLCQQGRPTDIFLDGVEPASFATTRLGNLDTKIGEILHSPLLQWIGKRNFTP